MTILELGPNDEETNAGSFHSTVTTTARIIGDPQAVEEHSAMVFPNGVHVPNVRRHPSGFRDWGEPSQEE